MGNLMALTATSLLLGTSLAAQADTVPVGNRINFNTGFGQAFSNTGDPLENWIITSGSVIARSAGYAIDRDDVPDSDERDTFDNAFETGTFAVFGDPSGKIGGDNQFGPSALIRDFRAPIRVGQQDVLSLNLNLSFDFAFDGIAHPDAAADTPADQFTVTLQRLQANQIHPVITVFSQSLGVTSPGQIGGHFEQALDLVAGAKYRLTFSLFEDDEEISGFPVQAFNSALGLDNVRVEGSATVVPLPPAAYLFASAVAGMASLGRRRPVAGA